MDTFEFNKLNLKKINSAVDVGCGNGKNMLYRKDCTNIGCDFSTGLVNICQKKILSQRFIVVFT